MIKLLYSETLNYEDETRDGRSYIHSEIQDVDALYADSVESVKKQFEAIVKSSLETRIESEFIQEKGIRNSFLKSYKTYKILSIYDEKDELEYDVFDFDLPKISIIIKELKQEFENKFKKEEKRRKRNQLKTEKEQYKRLKKKFENENSI